MVNCHLDRIMISNLINDNQGHPGKQSEEEPEVAGGSNEPELTRAERRDLKKKQAAAKQKGSGDEEDDEDLINTNHVEKKLNIADLGKDRQLSRRER